jgi:hypothetical protein
MIYPKAKKPSNHGSRSNPGRRAVVPAHFEGRVVTSESVQHLDETPETEVEVGEIKGSKKNAKNWKITIFKFVKSTNYYWAGFNVAHC